MNNCIIQLEVDHCPENGCSGPSVTNVGVFKNKTHARRFMRNDKGFRLSLIHISEPTRPY